MVAPNPQAPDSKLEPPTKDRFMAMLSKRLNADEAETLWNAACRRAGVANSRTPSVDELRQIAEAISEEGGVLQIMARSQIIRIKTFQFLSAQQEQEEALRS